MDNWLNNLEIYGNVNIIVCVICIMRVVNIVEKNKMLNLLM